nr:hypothetical protein [Anaerolineae bacterium]
MNPQAARRFTLKRLFFGDTLLNWFLAFVLIIFPGLVDRVLGRERLAPPLVYMLIGAGYLLFAAWQTYHVAQSRLGAPALYFAAAMAEGPVVLLTIILLMALPFRLGWRIVLWIGNIYMLLLGVWYIYVARISPEPGLLSD